LWYVRLTDGIVSNHLAHWENYRTENFAKFSHSAYLEHKLFVHSLTFSLCYLLLELGVLLLLLLLLVLCCGVVVAVLLLLLLLLLL
jgi:hypothetical protein